VKILPRKHWRVRWPVVAENVVVVGASAVIWAIAMTALLIWMPWSMTFAVMGLTVWTFTVIFSGRTENTPRYLSHENRQRLLAHMRQVRARLQNGENHAR